MIPTFLSLTMLFIHFGIKLGTADQPRCMYNFDIDVCTGRSSMVKPKCQNNDVCKKQFNVTYVDVEPYETSQITSILTQCCGECVRSKTTRMIKSVSEITPAVTNSSNFIFPVLAREDTTELYGQYFIPIIEPPTMYYITKKSDHALQKVILACFHMWPLLVICLMMVMVSGFLQWALDTWINKEQFPRSLLIGWFEGIWWSFISMSTVGYGDKTPKSIPGRLLTIVWIFIGITTFSMVTAMLSSEITKANTVLPPTISGEKVGALPHRSFDAFLIAQNGGIQVQANSSNATIAIPELITKLKKKEIHGFVLDRYMLIVIVADKLLPKSDVDFILTQTKRTEMKYNGDQMSYGMLVPNKADYDFFRHYIIDNLNVINTCNKMALNRGSHLINEQHVENPLFSTEGKGFWPSFTVVGSILIIFTTLGAVYEFFRRKNKQKKRSLENEQLKCVN